MRSSLAILLFVMILVSCEDPLENQKEVPGDLILTTQELFAGEVIEKGSTSLDDVDVWKIKIEHSSNAITTFYWRKSFTNLYRIVGEQGPFNYELKPPLDVVNFSTAKFLAFNQNQNDNLSSWQFMRSPGETKWFYQFYVKDSERPITIDAGSGEVIR